MLDAIGGPQVVLASVGKTCAAWGDESAFSVAITGAVTAKPLGKQLTAETTLLEWKP